MSRLVFAIPMKGPAISKTRLSGTLDDCARAQLARAMIRRTLEVVRRAACDKAVLVVTESPEIAAIAQEFGASVLVETRAEGLNAAARRAALWAIANGFDRLAILPADLPLMSARDIEGLAALPLDAGTVFLCEAVDGGTNCLLVSPPDAMDFRYGPHSCSAHRREARRQGLACFAVENSRMAFDLDTGQDLEKLPALRAQAGAEPGADGSIPPRILEDSVR